MKALNSSDSTAFHLQLLSNIIDLNNHPVTQLIIESNLTKEEYDELINMLHMLQTKYEVQKGEGFLDFTTLLIHFAGMLNVKLNPNATIYALKKEGYYPSLLTAFTTIIETDE